jgi:hypothetical protein
MSKVTIFLDFLGMTVYLQIIYFIPLEQSVKKILSNKISTIYTSEVLKLLQQKYGVHEDAIRKGNKGPLQFSKTVFRFSAPLLVLHSKIFKGNAFGTFWYAVCPVCT